MFVPSVRALRLARLLAKAKTGEQGAVNRNLQDSVGYPYVDVEPSARCRLLWHAKAECRAWTTGRGLVIEPYSCACGRRVWLSARAEGIGLERIR